MTKRLIIILILCLVFAGVVYGQDAKINHAWFNFDGQWLPDLESSKIGPNNFKTLQNLRPVQGGIEGVQGSTKVNTSIIPGNVYIENGIHFKKDNPSETHILISGGESGATKIYDNTTSIPNQGNFLTPIVYKIDASANLVRFSNAPGGNVVALDGKESLIWGGDEMRVAAFITSDSAVTNDTINLREYTEQVNNRLSTSDEVAVVGSGNPSGTVLLLHFNGLDDSTTFTDSSTGITSSPHTITVDTAAVLDTAQKKFGSASGIFDGGTSIYAADSVDWQMDNGDGSGTTYFTIDFWIKWNSGNTNGILHQGQDSDNYISINSVILDNDYLVDEDGNYIVDHEGNKIVRVNSYISLKSSEGGVEKLDYGASYPFETGVWYHIAIIKGWGGDLDDWAIAVNGTAINTFTDTNTWVNYESGLTIASTEENNTKYYLDGWLDEFRITKGILRWTSNFSPRVREYTVNSSFFVIATTRPISGASFYVYEGNALSGQTVTVQEWNGSSWTALALTGNTETSMGLYQSGKVSWPSTVDTSKPKFLEDRLFYWYQFVLSDGLATIYNVTVDAPMQPIIDLWDGVYRQPISFQVVDSTGTSNYTLEVNQPSSDLYPIGAKMGGLTATDHTVMIFEDRIQAVRLEMLGINQTVISGVSVNYWNGSDWVVQASIYDETDQEGASLNKSGTIAWQPPNREEEFRQTLYGVEGWAYKFVWNGTLDSAGNSSQTLIDVVYGIPAPVKVRPFKFPLIYKNRLLLAGYIEGNQGNRIDYSVTNTSEAWNGLESSMDGIQSIYVGGNEELTAGTQIYNRYGSNIITSLVLLKQGETYLLVGDGPTGDDRFKILPISRNIGCPASLTLATAEVSFEVSAAQSTRNLAMWLSYAGPVLFDGAVIIPLGGIDSFFDPSSGNYFGATNIENAVGWYDVTYKEYNLRIGSKWIVFNFGEKKWFEKYTPTMPTVGFPVTDTNGSKYIYSGTTTGYLMRQEYGTTWGETGSGIEQIVETGDFFPVSTGKHNQPGYDTDPWYQTRLRRLKVGYKVISEAVTLDIDYFKDSSSTATALSGVSLSNGSNAYNRKNQSLNLLGWQHRLKFSTTTSSTNKGLQSPGYGYQYSIEREDEN